MFLKKQYFMNLTDFWRNIYLNDTKFEKKLKQDPIQGSSQIRRITH